MRNDMKLEFLAISENEAFARVCAAAFAAQTNPTVDEVADIKTAVSEAVTNSIVHAYEERGGMVLLKMSIEENEITIEISDTGKGIENIDMAMEPMFTTDTGEDRSGMGFTVMQMLMDSVEVNSEVGKGTKVLMKKTIEG